MSEDAMKPLTYHMRRGALFVWKVVVLMTGIRLWCSCLRRILNCKSRSITCFFTGDMDLVKLKCSQQVAVPVLVATCNEQPAEIFAVACPRKGEHAYVQKTFGNYLRRLQRTKITLQTDQEEAIMSLMSKMPNEVKGEVQLTMQKSPVGSNQSNGRAERAVRNIGGLTRAVLFEMQKSTGHRVTVDDPLLIWGVRHAGWLYERYHVRQDSHLTAYHARCGKPYDGQITKFGASVLHMMPVKKSDKPKRLEHHWSYGVWVGKTEDSEEHIVLTSDGARIARTVRVLDETVAKEKALWLHVCGVPRDPRKASHPDGKKLQKVQPVPILLPQAVQPDMENQTSEHHEDENADQPMNENSAPAMPEGNDEMNILVTASSSSTTSRPACTGQHRAHTRLPGCNLWRPDAEKRSISIADNAVSKRGRVQEALDRERLSKRPQEDVPDLAYSLETAGAIPSDAMVTDGSTEQIDAPTDVDENLFGTVTDEMRQAGRMKELVNLKEFEVFESISVKDCVKDKVLGTTWVERLKNGECRSRLCVQDFAKTKSDEYFAPTPAEESTRILEAYAVRHGYRVRWADVGVAFLHAKELERVIVNPPAEWKRRYPGFMWLLKKCLYGRRAGPKRWYQTFRKTLVTLGLEASLVQPSSFRHPTSGVVMEPQVDDIEITGEDEEVEIILQRLGAIFLLKVAPIVEPGTISVFLGRRKMRTKDALYTAPSRSLLKSIVETLGLKNCRKIKSPTEKLTAMNDDNDLLDVTMSAIYRACVGKLLFASKTVWIWLMLRRSWSEISRSQECGAGEDLSVQAGTWREHWMHLVGKLDKPMYGTRDALAEWQAELGKTMIELAFRPVVSTPCLYCHSSLDVRVVGHVDDLMCVGPRIGLDTFLAKLMSIYDLTPTVLGPGPGEEQEGKFLGRTSAGEVTV